MLIRTENYQKHLKSETVPISGRMARYTPLKELISDPAAPALSEEDVNDAFLRKKRSRSACF